MVISLSDFSSRPAQEFPVERIDAIEGVAAVVPADVSAVTESPFSEPSESFTSRSMPGPSTGFMNWHPASAPVANSTQRHATMRQARNSSG